MRFGPVPPAEAEGAILAHSLSVGRTCLKKGRRLSAADVAALREAGLAEVPVARLEADDIGEDAAAEAVARALAPEPGALGLSVAAPFTGRANLFAAAAGVLRVDAAAVAALNAVDPAITLATLPDWSRVAAREMVATVKIIPYAVPRARLEAAVAALGPAPLRVHAFRPARAALILTRTPGKVTGADVAAMGVGGLLKEIPTRPQPRAAAPGRARPRVEAIVLAAGAARRMAGRDKLLEPVGGRPMLAAVAAAAAASQADRVLVVLPPDSRRRAALAGSRAEVVEAPEWREGMAASLRAGLARVSDEADAVVIMLADMPEVTAAHVDRLIAAFDPAEGRDICRAVDAEGTPGHPVLFGRRFFESLNALTGDRGARDVLREAAEFVTEVPTPGRGATLDLDTPADWEAWRE